MKSVNLGIRTVLPALLLACYAAGAGYGQAGAGFFDWCNSQTTDNITISYCEGGSYQLCAFGVEGGALMYIFFPVYQTGCGTLNQSTGLWTWTGATVPESGFVDIEFLARDAFEWTPTTFVLHVTIDTGDCDCCVARVGDANNSGDDEPTIGDVSAIIDYLFISGTPLTCLEEADVNQSGGLTVYTDDVTVGDVSALIEYLFITGPETGVLPECL